MKHTLDARGLACPLPVIKVKQALQHVSQGLLEVRVDNRIAVENLERLSKNQNLAYSIEKIAEDEYLLEIQVDDQTPLETQTNPLPVQLRKNTIVILASELMGEGDPKLGKILMHGFIYALTELEERPAKILLYNSAVKLACQGSESLNDLGILAKQGVEILSCGTCLDFYGYKEKLAVGSVTNMYEIAQSSLDASLIVRP